MAEDPFTACAEQLAATPGLVQRLLDDHVSTDDGWCRAHDGHAERHPCSIRRLAEMATVHLARPVRPAPTPPAGRVPGRPGAVPGQAPPRSTANGRVDPRRPTPNEHPHRRTAPR